MRQPESLGSPPHRRGKGRQCRRLQVKRRITPAQAGKSECNSSSSGVRWDHPRTGGEKNAFVELTRFSTGSPPHRRGKACIVISTMTTIRITPAQAGKRDRQRLTRHTPRDHPRTGGEKLSFGPAVDVVLGSPPHRRGKAYGLSVLQRPSRITPAQAGKSLAAPCLSRQRRDHPRTGGEKQATPQLPPSLRGSPPHRRGKGRPPERNGGFDRITPAQAGKSAVFHAVSAGSWDHPRTGGEKLGVVFVSKNEQGSPPHRRGKATNSKSPLALHGITPAQAGKRLLLIFPLTRFGDHPRTGGEKLYCGSIILPGSGSPPHRRGKAGSAIRCSLQVRITPAQAGKSNRRSRKKSRRRDHPRTGGEKVCKHRVIVAESGSPPHRRGKDTKQQKWNEQRGITPAQAGKRSWNARCNGAPEDHPRTGGEKSAEHALSETKIGSPPHRRGKDVRNHGKGRKNGITPAQAGKSDSWRCCLSLGWDHPRTGGEKACPDEL